MSDARQLAPQVIHVSHHVMSSPGHSPTAEKSSPPYNHPNYIGANALDEVPSLARTNTDTVEESPLESHDRTHHLNLPTSHCLTTFERLLNEVPMPPPASVKATCTSGSGSLTVAPPSLENRCPTREAGILRVSNISLCWEDQPSVSKTAIYIKLWTANSKTQTPKSMVVSDGKCSYVTWVNFQDGTDRKLSRDAYSLPVEHLDLRVSHWDSEHLQVEVVAIKGKVLGDKEKPLALPTAIPLAGLYWDEEGYKMTPIGSCVLRLTVQPLKYASVFPKYEASSPSSTSAPTGGTTRPAGGYMRGRSTSVNQGQQPPAQSSSTTTAILSPRVLPAAAAPQKPKASLARRLSTSVLESLTGFTVSSRSLMPLGGGDLMSFGGVVAHP